MSIPPIDHVDHPNPFQIEKSRLFKLTESLHRQDAERAKAQAQQQSQQVPPPDEFVGANGKKSSTTVAEAASNAAKKSTTIAESVADAAKTSTTVSESAASASEPVGGKVGLPKHSAHFTISIRDIMNLVQRWRIRSMTYEQLRALPLSQLNPQERDFVNYMRRNPYLFNRLASLDNDPDTLSEKDIRMAARLSRDTLVLTDEDLNNLQQAQRAMPRPAQPVQRNVPTNRNESLKTDDLIRMLNRLDPDEKGLPYSTLMAIDPDESGLYGPSLRALRFLQRPSVSKVLQKLVQPYHEMLSPEVLRVLTSLIWNPAIYGAAPVVFFKTSPLHADMDIEPIGEVHTVDPVDDDRHEQIRPTRRKPTLRLAAHNMLDICHRISPEDGHVSLEQLRQYVPQNEDEEKALNLLRQSHVFEALANMDDDPGSLSDEDIKLALAEGALVLSDPFMVLVILP